MRQAVQRQTRVYDERSRVVSFVFLACEAEFFRDKYWRIWPDVGPA